MSNEVIVFFDTETTGKADMKQSPEANVQPDMVQLAATLYDDRSQTIWCSVNAVIHPHESADLAKPRLFTIGDEVAGIHGITDATAIAFGQPRRTILSQFNYMCRNASTMVSHDIDFDLLVMTCAYFREGVPDRMKGLKQVCTMRAATPVVKLPKPWKGKSKPGDEYKWPSLTECYQHFFGTGFDGAHNAMNDVIAMMKVWSELRKLKVL